MKADIKISDIIFPGDYKLPDDFSRTKESISLYGLFHDPILQGDEPPYKIVAGRARVFAMKDLGKIVIPATILPESCLNPHEIALHENLRRNNLPWYDQVELEKELHEMRMATHGKRNAWRPKKGESSGWSQRETAKELGIAIGRMSEDIALAIELQRNPNLRNVKDKTTAIKLIKQIAKRNLAEIEQALPTEINMDEIYLGDSENILKNFPSGTFDACITDPPWSEYKDEALKSDQAILLPIFFELYRVLKRDAFLFVITSTTDFYFYKRELPKLGFRVQSYPIVWQKPKTITHGRAPWQFARDYEPIVVAVKGDPSLTTGIELSSILKFDNLHYSKMIHPHEKPIELIKSLLQWSTHPGAKVIDVFAGSGVTLEACKNSDRRFIGIEKDKKFYEGIVERLKK